MENDVNLMCQQYNQNRDEQKEKKTHPLQKMHYNISY
mgnify:CR=1 FL=1